MSWPLLCYPMAGMLSSKLLPSLTAAASPSPASQPGLCSSCPVETYTAFQNISSFWGALFSILSLPCLNLIRAISAILTYSAQFFLSLLKARLKLKSSVVSVCCPVLEGITAGPESPFGLSPFPALVLMVIAYSILYTHGKKKSHIYFPVRSRKHG